MPQTSTISPEQGYASAQACRSLDGFLRALQVADHRRVRDRLLAELGSPAAVFAAPRHRLARVLGADHPAIAPLLAARRLSLVAFDVDAGERPRLASREALRRHLVNLMAGEDREIVRVFFADQRLRLIRAETLFRGSRREASISLRLIAHRAMELNASKILLAHNHPSGDPTPSLADRSITHRLRSCLAELDLELIDHLVVGGSEVRSILFDHPSSVCPSAKAG